MPLPDSLLAVARDLSALDPRRPRQASLRRAVSAAYYALFHLLAGEAARRMCGADARLRESAFRDFTHSGVKSVIADSLMPAANRPKRLQELLGSAALSPQLQDVCQAFSDSLAERERADYELGRYYRRSMVTLLLSQVERAFASWQAVRATEQGQHFMMALVLYSRGRSR